MGDWSDSAAELAKLLGLPDATDILQYVLSITVKQDIEEYLNSILDETNPQHQKFIKKFLWKFSHGGNLQTPDNCDVSDGQVNGGKKDVNKKTFVKDRVPSTQPAKIENGMQHQSAQSEVKAIKPSRKPKYSPLFSLEGQAKLVMHLPGRVLCDCQASKHKLINNCLICGRIVCEQEGSGPCLFCGELVCTNEEQELLDRNTSASHQLYQSLMGKTPKSGIPRGSSQDKSDYQKAVEHKNMLLEFDRTVERRTKVFDDQADYFTIDNRWLSKEERDAVMKREKDIKAKKEADRKAVKVNFDFAGRQIVEDKENYEVINEQDLERELQKLSTSDQQRSINPNLLGFQRPIFQLSDEASIHNRQRRTSDDKHPKYMRLQDRELQQMSDEGWCLSLHQPHASLLVSGLKRHEGRVWYTPVRGRLWIASTSKPPSSQDIQMTEQTLRILRHDDNIIFPIAYPVGALLGCVNLVDCVPQEEYRSNYIEREIEDPYVFICENPQELVVKFPVRGQHKIYKLDRKIHDAAKRALKPLS